MSEVYKITNMLVTDEDRKHIDKNWQSIIDEYIKTFVREKDLVIAQYLMKKQKDEIERLKNGCKELEQQIDDLYKLETTLTNENERLNNIIKEAREYIEERYNGEVLTHTFDKDNVGQLLEILDKGSDEISK